MTHHKLNRRVMASAALVLLSACATMPETGSTTRRTATLTRGDIRITVSASGVIEAEDEVKLGFEASGVVKRVAVKVGDVVRQGDLLAELDTTNAQLDLRRAQVSLKDAEFAAVIAQYNYSRTLETAQPADIAAGQAAVKAASENYKKLAAGPLQADVQAAQATLANAEADVRRAQAAYDNANRQDPASISAHPAALALERATNNYALAKAQYDKAIQPASQADLSNAQLRIADAKAQLRRARTTVNKYDILRAKTEIDQALNRVEQIKLDVEQVQRKLNQMRIVAASNGIVSAVDVKVGSMADTQPVISVVDTTRLRIDVNVDEVDVTDVEVDQEVLVKLDSVPDVTFIGRVERISPTSKTVNGVVTYATRVTLLTGKEKNAPNAPEDMALLKPGMTADAEITLEMSKDVVLVPLWAVRKDSDTGKRYITVRDAEPTDNGLAENPTKEVEVKLGLRDGSMGEVISGATEGQVVFEPVVN